MLSEPTSPTLSESTSSRFSWNPYTGGNGSIQHWFGPQPSAARSAAGDALRLSPPLVSLQQRRSCPSDALSSHLSDRDREEIMSNSRRDDLESVSWHMSPPQPNGLMMSEGASLHGSQRHTSLCDEAHASGDGRDFGSSDGADSEALEAIGRLRRVKRDENVPSQFRRYNKGMQRRISAAIARDETLLLDLCENERGNIVVTIMEVYGSLIPDHALQSNNVTLETRAPSPRGSAVDAASEPDCSSTKRKKSKISPSSANGNCPAVFYQGMRIAAERILSLITQHSWRLCTGKGGCVAVTRLLHVIPSRQRHLLEDFVVDHFLALSVHPFGNYVVQRILERHTDESVLRSILIHVSIPSSVIAIASNKFGSHVLEGFFRFASVSMCITALDRLLRDAETTRFLVNDKFGNYVVQQAMKRVSAAADNMMSSPSPATDSPAQTQVPDGAHSALEVDECSQNVQGDFVVGGTAAAAMQRAGIEISFVSAPFDEDGVDHSVPNQPLGRGLSSCSLDSVRRGAGSDVGAAPAAYHMTSPATRQEFSNNITSPVSQPLAPARSAAEAHKEFMQLLEPYLKDSSHAQNILKACHVTPSSD